MKILKYFKRIIITLLDDIENFEETNNFKTNKLEFHNDNITIKSIF